jgi:hypothetical protein
MLFPSKREVPHNMTLSGGDAWFILRRQTAEIIKNYINEHPDYISYMTYCFCPDEMFFNTLAYNLIGKDGISDDILRYVSWGTETSCSPFDITKDDFELLESNVEKGNIFFIRKIKDLSTSYVIDKLIEKGRMNNHLYETMGKK